VGWSCLVAAGAVVSIDGVSIGGGVVDGVVESNDGLSIMLGKGWFQMVVCYWC